MAGMRSRSQNLSHHSVLTQIAFSRCRQFSGNRREKDATSEQKNPKANVFRGHYLVEGELLSVTESAEMTEEEKRVQNRLKDKTSSLQLKADRSKGMFGEIPKDITHNPNARYEVTGDQAHIEAFQKVYRQLRQKRYHDSDRSDAMTAAIKYTHKRAEAGGKSFDRKISKQPQKSLPSARKTEHDAPRPVSAADWWNRFT